MLKENTEFINTIIERSPVAIMVMSSDGRIIQENKANEKLWKISKKNLGEYNVFRDKQIKTLGLLPYIERSLEGETLSLPPFEFEPLRTRHVTKGRKCWIQSNIFPIKNGDGNIRTIIMMHNDITEQKQLEQRHEHLNKVMRSVSNVKQLIFKERNRITFIQKVCKILISNHGYYQAWIVLLDKQGKYLQSAKAGMGKNFATMIQSFEKGEFGNCGNKALKQKKIIIVQETKKECKDCLHSTYFSKHGVYTSRIIHDGMVYGLISVSAPKSFIKDKEEQHLFQELVGDIAFALYEIAFEEEQKRAENKVKISELRYRRLFESAKDGILILDAVTGVVVDVNPFLTELLGYSSDQLIGKAIWELGFFSDTAINRENFIELKLKGYIRYEDLPLKTVDGRRIEVEFVSNVYQVDSKDVIQCNIRDITERKRTEEALDKERNLLKTLMNSIPDHIYFKDKESRFIMINKALSESFNLNTVEDAIGKTDFDFFTEEYGWRTFVIEQEIIRTGQFIIGIEEKEAWSQHSETWVSTTKMPLVDEKGNIIGTFGISRDITERKRKDERIYNNLKEKELLLRELNHRTKNNMQVICSLLRLQASKLQDHRVKELFKEIETKIYSMSLVHQELIMSEDLSHINLKDYFGKLNIYLEQSYGEYMKNVSIHSDIADIVVLIDTAVPLGLVFNELISNVVKHAFPENTKGEINVHLYSSPQNEIILEISDNGIGFPKGFNIQKDISLGLKTVISLVEDQIQGQIQFINKHGLLCRILIKKEQYKPRI